MYLSTLRIFLPFLLLAAAATIPVLATPLTFVGSGIGTGGNAISSTVTFDFVTHDFGSGAVNAVQVTVTNTAASTLARGNLITGVFFNLSGGVGNLPTVSAGFNGLAALVALADGSTTTNVDIAPAVNSTATEGGYQLSNGPFGLANDGSDFSGFRYGISTVGSGLTGFSGAAVNGDNYGIFAAGSATTSGGMASARPLIDTTAVFWIARPVQWVTLFQLGTSVRVTYGSRPDNFITATANGVPEPSTLSMLGVAVAMAAISRRWRRSR